MTNEDIIKYLHFEVPQKQRGKFFAVWLFIINIIGLPVVFSSVWRSMTLWLIIILVLLEFWGIVIIGNGEKYYRKFTLWLGVASLILSIFILIGIMKMAYYGDKTSDHSWFTYEKLFWMFAIYFCTVFFIYMYMYMFILLKTGYFSKGGKAKTPATKIITTSSIFIVVVGHMLSRLIPIHDDAILLAGGFLAGAFGGISYKIHQYFMIKKFDVFSPYLGQYEGELQNDICEATKEKNSDFHPLS